MDKRTVEVSLQTAREWYKSGNKALKEVALQAFSEEELTRKSFRDIKKVGDAIRYLNDNNMCYELIDEYRECPDGSYSKKLCEYRIIVAALTNNEERKLKTGDCWFPIVQFCEIGKEKNCWGNKRIGTIEHDGKKYVIVGGHAHGGTRAGLGGFHSDGGVSGSYAHVGFRSVSSREIAEYISEQFGRLLFDIHYGGVNCDWEWVD